MSQLSSRLSTADETFSAEENEYKKLRALWRAIILQAVQDASSESKKKLKRYHKKAAERWLSDICPDFKYVCEMADMDPHITRRKAKDALNRRCVWRKQTLGRTQR